MCTAIDSQFHHPVIVQAKTWQSIMAIAKLGGFDSGCDGTMNMVKAREFRETLISRELSFINANKELELERVIQGDISLRRNRACLGSG